MNDRAQDTDSLLWTYDRLGRRCRVGKGKGRIKGVSREVYFWQSIEPMMDDRGCWEWNGDRFKRGYGRVAEGVYAHRFSYQMHNGNLPKGTVVRHRCDNVSCVNPAHLEIGTQLDNMRDKVKRGRQPKFGLPDDAPCPSGHTHSFKRYYKTNKKGQRYLCRTCMACRDLRMQRAA